MSIFSCKTGEAYYIKILSELLTNNLKCGCFEVQKDGIFLRMFDHHRKTLVDLTLISDNFSVYKLRNDEKICMGINLNHFHKMLKSIKKKDSLQLFIDKDNITDLYIKTIPKENTRITTSGIKIQTIQNLKIDIPTGYRKPVIVPSSEFQKMCKDLSNIGSSIINVIVKKFHIEFIADADGILKRKVTFGEMDEDSENESGYYASFTTDQITRISKISGLSNIIHVFSGEPHLPLLFRSSVGSLGQISIYIKSKEIVDNEFRSYDDSEDSD